MLEAVKLGDLRDVEYNLSACLLFEDTSLTVDTLQEGCRLGRSSDDDTESGDDGCGNTVPFECCAQVNCVLRTKSRKAESRKTPLHLACEVGRASVVAALIEHNADIEAVDPKVI